MLAHMDFGRESGMHSGMSTQPTVATPCVNVCVVDDASGLCIGCRRSLAEIAAWATLSAAERSRIIGALRDRRIVEGGKVSGR